MATLITLVIITSIFSITFYGLKALWHKTRKPITAEAKADLDLFAASEQRDHGLARLKLAELLEENEGGIPLRPLLFMSSLSMVIAVLCGFAFLNYSYRSAPIQKLREVSAPLDGMQVPIPRVLRKDFVGSHKVRVVVDDSGPDAPPVEDLLKRCAAFEITYVTPEGVVKCYSEGSVNAQKLLDRTRLDSDCMQQGFGAIVAAATAEVAKEVAERKPIDRYAELVYFVLTFFGVFLRLCWDSLQIKRHGRKPPLITPQSVITSLVLAIATYAMVIQSGLAGSSDLLNFKVGIFALYNGLLAPTLLKDLASLRGAPAATPATP